MTIDKTTFKEMENLAEKIIFTYNLSVNKSDLAIDLYNFLDNSEDCQTSTKPEILDASLYDFDDGNGLVPAHRHPNGGGWVADSAIVSESAYVSVDAKVFGKAKVLGNARVFENAEVYGDVKCG